MRFTCWTERLGLTCGSKLKRLRLSSPDAGHTLRVVSNGPGGLLGQQHDPDLV
jgi:hypothetical protein